MLTRGSSTTWLSAAQLEIIYVTKNNNGRNGSYFTWLATSNEGDEYGQQISASPTRLILNKFRIYD